MHSKLYIPARSATLPYIVHVTPESAGWSETSLQVLELDTSQVAELHSADTEVMILPLAGGGTVATLAACAQAVDELAAHGLIAMLEPFLSTRVDGKVRNDLSPDAVIKSVHIAQGLGSTSAFTWMKLPVVEEMDRVMESTTLPTLLLGGDPADPDEAFASWEKALELPSVRGLIVGRTLLYPADGDVSSAVATAVSMVR